MENPEDGTIVLTREELYERVWTTAMRHLGPELGVSDVGLKKICKRFHIPTPPAGYWAKKVHGKAPKRPRLPRYDDSGLEGIKFCPKGDQAKLASRIDEYAQKEKLPENRIEVPQALDVPHPFVERTLRSLRAARPDDDGLVQPRAKKTLNVHVAPNNVDRAMLVFDSLLKALDKRHTPIELVASEDRYDTVVTLMDETIRLTLFERTQREERDLTVTEKRDAERWPAFYGNKHYFHYVPTDRLCLQILSGPSNGRRRCYADGARQRLEGLLNAFVVCLYRTAEDIKVERNRLEELRLEREAEEERRRQREAERQRRLEEIRQEEAKLGQLLSETAAWQKSRAIREFVDAFKEAAIVSEGQLDEEQERVITWALAHADRFDPLVPSPPSVLDEKAKWERPSYHW